MEITDMGVTILEHRTETPSPWARLENIVLVQVQTDEGITGVGEVSTHHGSGGEASLSVKAIIEKGFRSFLIGKDPLEVRKLWEEMYTRSLWYGRRGLAIFAMSGVDMALMDIVGKVMRQPVCKILGGAYRDKVRVYASTGEFNAEEVRGYLDQGFTAIKFGAGWEFAKNPMSMKKNEDMVREMRKGVGEDVDLMVDLGTWFKWPVPYAIRMAKRFEKYDIFWLEEPITQDDIDGYAAVTRSTGIFIAAGESVYTRHGFREIIDRRAVDVIQPDITKVGGITEGRRIADMAELRNVMLVPHSWSSAINEVAGLHLAASMRDGFLMEFWAWPTPFMTELLEDPLEVENGYVEVPSKPGLGIELDEKAVKKYSIKT